jgi:NADH-quinone oxidoreductase subunit H
MKFGLFFLGEYAYTVGIAAIAATLFLGGWKAPWGILPQVGALWLVVKIFLVFMVIFWLRGTFPRVRVDQLMGFAWKFLLPLALINIFFSGLEVLLWQENDLPAEVVLPAFAIGNLVLTVVLIVGWAQLLGRGRPQYRPTRARLVKELGAVVYGQEA